VVLGETGEVKREECAEELEVPAHGNGSNAARARRGRRRTKEVGVDPSHDGARFERGGLRGS